MPKDGEIIIRDAEISECGRYRYWLRRTWEERKLHAIFVMLNPSTADAEKDDATIRKCCGFARRWEYGGILVFNLFAYRATRVEDLKQARDPIGPENDRWIKMLIGRTSGIWKEPNILVVAAWGNDGRWFDRSRQMMDLLRGMDGVDLKRLGPTTASGQPRHPLYAPYGSRLEDA